MVGFDRWCWPYADPRTLLPLDGIAEHDFGPHVWRALELEYSGGEFAAKHVLARSDESACSLGIETGGDLARSQRWDEVMRPVGIGDVATVACRDMLGCWGWIEAYRDDSDGVFEEEDLELLADVGDLLGGVLRRASVSSIEPSAVEAGGPGVVVLSPDLGVSSWTEPARGWIDALPAAALFASWGMLPPPVYPVATLSRSPGSAGDAQALQRAADGRWVMIEAAPLGGEDDGRIAVSFRRATPTETFDVLCRGHGLTRRERAVVAALLAGLDTRAVTTRLFISPHTVQDHLKSVFDKVGVHSRRELLTTFTGSPEPA